MFLEKLFGMQVKFGSISELDVAIMVSQKNNNNNKSLLQATELING